MIMILSIKVACFIKTNSDYKNGSSIKIKSE